MSADRVQVFGYKGFIHGKRQRFLPGAGSALFRRRLKWMFPQMEGLLGLYDSDYNICWVYTGGSPNSGKLPNLLSSLGQLHLPCPNRKRSCGNNYLKPPFQQTYPCVPCPPPYKETRSVPDPPKRTSNLAFARVALGSLLVSFRMGVLALHRIWNSFQELLRCFSLQRVCQTCAQWP